MKIAWYILRPIANDHGTLSDIVLAETRTEARQQDAAKGEAPWAFDAMELETITQQLRAAEMAYRETEQQAVLTALLTTDHPMAAAATEDPREAPRTGLMQKLRFLRMPSK